MEYRFESSGLLNNTPCQQKKVRFDFDILTEIVHEGFL